MGELLCVDVVGSCSTFTGDSYEHVTAGEAIVSIGLFLLLYDGMVLSVVLFS